MGRARHFQALVVSGMEIPTVGQYPARVEEIRMQTRTPIAAGNWKMNGAAASLSELTELTPMLTDECETLICPPATLIDRAANAAKGSRLMIGGQDCHANAAGAHTGDVSADMLADAGATHVILGHSERRADHHETDAVVCAKIKAAWAAGLIAILCVGESEAEREAGQALDVVSAQLAASTPDGAAAANMIVAYEPIWAIGTGKIPTMEEIAEMHGHMRAELASRFGGEDAGMRLLYGGSVKPANAAEIFALEDVDGALVGGASLKAADFSAIIAALGAA